MLRKRALPAIAILLLAGCAGPTRVSVAAGGTVTAPRLSAGVGGVLALRSAGTVQFTTGRRGRVVNVLPGEQTS